MSHRYPDSPSLRRVAEELIDHFAAGTDSADELRDDLVTSLVRQWVTYDGHACLFADPARQIYFELRRTPLGEPYVSPEPAAAIWLEWLGRDWGLGPDDLADILNDLNRGQAGELVTPAGIRLRVYVDPRDRKLGVEPVDDLERLKRLPPNYPRVAAAALAPHLGPAVSPAERDRLAKLVDAQWGRYDDHAGLFLDGRRLLAIKLHLKGDGTCEVGVRRLAVNVLSTTRSRSRRGACK